MEEPQAVDLREWILNNYRELGLDGRGLFLGRNIFILRLGRSNNKPAGTNYYRIYGIVVNLIKNGIIPDFISRLNAPPRTDVSAMKEYIQYRYYLEGTELRDTADVRSIRLWFVPFERFLARLETGPELKGTQNRELRQSLTKTARDMEQDGEIKILQGNIFRIIGPWTSIIDLPTTAETELKLEAISTLSQATDAQAATLPTSTQQTTPPLQTQITSQVAPPFSAQPLLCTSISDPETIKTTRDKPLAIQTSCCHENFSEESSIKAKSETVSEISVLPSISISSSCPDIHILDGIARSLISEDPCTPGNDSMDSDGEHGRIVVFSTDFGPLRNISMEYFKLLGSPTSTLQKYPKDRSPDNRIYFSALNASAFFVYGLQSSGMSDTAVCLLESFLLEHNPTKAQPDEKPHGPSGLVFHYTGFTFLRAFKPCEAVSLAGMYDCASEAETLAATTNIFVTPFNFSNMKKAYSRVSHAVVRILRLRLDRLNPVILLAILFPEGTDPKSLCYQKISQLLRYSVIQSAGIVDYNWFVEKIRQLTIDEDDRVRFLLKLELLETFLTAEESGESFSSELANPGTLTIVDLSCPFIDSNMASALFNLCLEEYMEVGSRDLSRVVMLDGAHKFITDGKPASDLLTEHILGLRLQDQHSTKIIVSGEQASLPPELLSITDSDSMLFIHRFTDLARLQLFRDLSTPSNNTNCMDELLNVISTLDDDECLLFAPSTFISASHLQSLQHLSRDFLRLRVRKRTTTPIKDSSKYQSCGFSASSSSMQAPTVLYPTAASVLTMGPIGGVQEDLDETKMVARFFLNELLFRKPQPIFSQNIPPLDGSFMNSSTFDDCQRLSQRTQAGYLNGLNQEPSFSTAVPKHWQPPGSRLSFNMFDYGDCAETIPFASIPASLESVETHSATAFVSQLSQLKTFLQDPPAYPSPVFLPPCDKCRSLMFQLDGKCLLRSALGWIDKARWRIETPFSQVGVIIPAGPQRTLGLTRTQMEHFNSLLMADTERIYEMLDSITASSDPNDPTREIYTEFIIPYRESNRIYKADDNGNLSPYLATINERTLPLCTVFCAIAYILSVHFAPRLSQTKQEAFSIMVILADWCKKLSPWYYPKVVSVIVLKGYESAVGGDNGVKLGMVLGTSKPSNMGMNSSYYDADWGLRKLGYQMKLQRRAALQRAYQLGDEAEGD